MLIICKKYKMVKLSFLDGYHYRESSRVNTFDKQLEQIWASLVLKKLSKFSKYDVEKAKFVFLLKNKFECSFPNSNILLFAPLFSLKFCENRLASIECSLRKQNKATTMFSFNKTLNKSASVASFWNIYFDEGKSGNFSK